MAVKSLHPGLELQEILRQNNITQRDFAAKIGITLSLLNSILKGTRNINVNIAINLQAAGYGDAKEWLNKQIDHLISVRESDEEFSKRKDIISTWKRIEQLTPTAYFKRESLLKNSIAEDIKVVYEIYNVKDIDQLEASINNYRFKHFRKSSAFVENKNNIIAWAKVAEYNARQMDCTRFDKTKELDLIKELKKCFFKNNKTILTTEKILNKYGIKFLILDRPEKTPVDGQSFMSNENPTIVLTLKYNRLDNFAFNIMHELGHVFKHFTQAKYKNDAFFEMPSNTEKEEFEANLYARDHLIDPKVWEDFLYSNDEYDDDTIYELSRDIKVHPGIIRGRLCFQYPEYYSKRSTINRENILK